MAMLVWGGGDIEVDACRTDDSSFCGRELRPLSWYETWYETERDPKFVSHIPIKRSLSNLDPSAFSCVHV